MYVVSILFIRPSRVRLSGGNGKWVGGCYAVLGIILSLLGNGWVVFGFVLVLLQEIASLERVFQVTDRKYLRQNVQRLKLDFA